MNPKKNAKIESEDEEEKMGVLGDLAPSLVYFVDPIKEAKGEASITESQADRKKRMMLYTLMEKAIKGNHPDCVSMCVRGDVYGLFTQVCQIVRQNYPQHNFDVLLAVAAVSNQTAIGAYQPFLEKIMSLVAKAKVIQKKGQGDLLPFIATAVINAMRKDGRFLAAVDNLETMVPPPSYETVLASL